MSQKLPDCIDILLSVKAIPDCHNRDFPVVAVLGCEDWKHDQPYPFASIIAVEPKQIMADRAHQAIHVGYDNDGFFWSMGAYALDDRCALIVAKEPFPELLYYLRKTRQSFRPLIKAKYRQKPWIHVKNWHLQDMTFDDDSPQPDAAEAHAILRRWQGWEKDKKSWIDRFAEVNGYNISHPKFVPGIENKFQKFCNAMGLSRGDGKDFQKQFEALDTAIILAKQVAYNKP